MNNAPDELILKYLLDYIETALTPHTDLVRIKIPSKLEESAYKLEPKSSKPFATPLLHAVKWLAAINYIEATALKPEFSDKGSLIIEGPMDIRVKNRSGLHRLTEQVQGGHLETILKSLPPFISYNSEKTIGYAVINDNEVRLTDQSKRLFDILYQNADKWLDQETVLKYVVGREEGFNSSAAKYEFNDLVQNLEKRLALLPNN